MTVEPGWVPPGVDTTKANVARVYDYWVGGNHNFQADRDLARTIIALDPHIRLTMRANRAFLGRAVRFLAGQAGIRQFLDIGSGIPTENNVHQVAQAAAPGSRVVYVDNDEVAVAHSRLLLADNPDATVIQADLREPAKILADPETQLLLDFTQPVAVFLVAVLHFIPDSELVADIVATLRDALAPGSYLVICHACRDEQPSLATSFESVYNSRVTAQLAMRSRDEITRLCDGFTLLEPGLVWIPQWRPDFPDDVPEEPSKYWALVGVGRYDGPQSSECAVSNQRRVTEMSDEQSGEASGPGEEALQQELAQNVVESRDLPPGYQLEGPAEPGADADVPGVLGGPGINIISETEDEPDNGWSEHPR